jgi:hypothetical protein
MRTKEFIKIEEQLLPELPGFAIKGRLMLIAPLGEVLRGILFQPSAFSKKAFHVNMFMMPLCVSAKYLHLTIGKGVRHQNGPDGWHADEADLLDEMAAALRIQAVPFLSRGKSLVGFVEEARSFESGNPHIPKAIGFALARAGDTGAAIEVLDQLIKQLDPNVTWQNEMAKEVGVLRAMLIASPGEAQLQLAASESETVQNLGLEAFR